MGASFTDNKIAFRTRTPSLKYVPQKLPYVGNRKQAIYHINLSYWCFHIVRDYKTIQFNIKILLNIHNFKFAPQKFYIATLRTEIFKIILTLALPPPPHIRKMDRRPC